MKGVETKAGAVTPQSNGVILVIGHQDTAGPALFGQELAAIGIPVEFASFADGNAPKLPLGEYLAVVILGGTPNTDEVAKYPWLADEKQAIGELLDRNVPLFGICLGGQLIAELSGAKVGPMRQISRGWSMINLTAAAAEDPIFGGLGDRIETLSWHKYAFELPSESISIAVNDVSPQAFRLANRPVWGVQFHPEASPESVAVWLDEARLRGDLSEERHAAEKVASERCRVSHREQAKVLCERFVSYAVAQRESQTQ